MNCYHPKNVRDWLQDFPGGMMFFLGCHLVDLILSLQGKPEKVIPYNKCTGFENVTSKDFGMALFEYKNGISFAKTSAVELGGFERRLLVVTGTKGSIELKPLEWYVADSSKVQTYRSIRTSSEWGEKGEENVCPPYDRYVSMMKSFAEYVCGDKENPYTLDYELELYKTLLKDCGE